jgi:hypothetical protein
VSCSSDSDCGAGKQCANAGTTSAYCSNCPANSQCTCPSGQLANGSGGCVRVVCSNNTVCGAGRQCIDPGKYNAKCDPCPSGTQCTCPSGQVADGSGGCKNADACANVTCSAGKKCVSGQCTNCTKGETCGCPSGQVANGSGGCEKVDACANVTCSKGKKCVGGVCTNCANGEYAGCNCPTLTDSTTGKQYITVATGWGSCRHPCNGHKAYNEGLACFAPGPGDNYSFNPSNPYQSLYQPCACNSDCNKFGYGSKCLKRKGSQHTFCYTPCTGLDGISGGSGCWIDTFGAWELAHTSSNDSSSSFCGSSNSAYWNQQEICFTNTQDAYYFTDIMCSTMIQTKDGNQYCQQYQKGDKRRSICYSMPVGDDQGHKMKHINVCAFEYNYDMMLSPSSWGLPDKGNFWDPKGTNDTYYQYSDYEELSTCPSGYPNNYR